MAKSLRLQSLCAFALNAALFILISFIPYPCLMIGQTPSVFGNFSCYSAAKAAASPSSAAGAISSLRRSISESRNRMKTRTIRTIAGPNIYSHRPVLLVHLTEIEPVPDRAATLARLSEQVGIAPEIDPTADDAALAAGLVLE